MSTETELGAIILLSPPGEGNTAWTAKQSNLGITLPPKVGAPRTRKEFEWNLGPLSATGYIDTDTFDTGVVLTVLGINLGTIYGNAGNGVLIKLDLVAAKGDVKFDLNGRQLLIHMHVEVVFDGPYDCDYIIIEF
ncbi:hypothetical protein F4775DRAFT_589248 [Biscogniauxia sp. FL1348]|nr:hypothetical protein F4775DRAFT_589248 [Biscogniauxia sp. FL1348]